MLSLQQNLDNKLIIVLYMYSTLRVKKYFEFYDKYITIYYNL